MDPLPPAAPPPPPTPQQSFNPADVAVPSIVAYRKYKKAKDFNAVRDDFVSAVDTVCIGVQHASMGWEANRADQSKPAFFRVGASDNIESFLKASDSGKDYEFIVNKLQNLHPPDNYALPTGSPSYLISLQPSANSLSLFQQRYPNLYGQVFRQRSLTLRREKMGENTTWLNEHDFEETEDFLNGQKRIYEKIKNEIRCCLNDGSVPTAASDTQPSPGNHHTTPASISESSTSSNPAFDRHRNPRGRVDTTPLPSDFYLSGVGVGASLTTSASASGSSTIEPPQTTFHNAINVEDEADGHDVSSGASNAPNNQETASPPPSDNLDPSSLMALTTIASTTSAGNSTNNEAARTNESDQSNEKGKGKEKKDPGEAVKTPEDGSPIETDNETENGNETETQEKYEDDDQGLDDGFSYTSGRIYSRGVTPASVSGDDEHDGATTTPKPSSSALPFVQEEDGNGVGSSTSGNVVDSDAGDSSSGNVVAGVVRVREDSAPGTSVKPVAKKIYARVTSTKPEDIPKVQKEIEQSKKLIEEYDLTLQQLTIQLEQSTTEQDSQDIVVEISNIEGMLRIQNEMLPLLESQMRKMRRALKESQEQKGEEIK